MLQHYEQTVIFDIGRFSGASSKGESIVFKLFGAVATATAFVALCNVASAQAPAPLPTSIQVSMPGDGQMACPQIAMEIGRMDQIMGQAAANQASAQTSGAVAGAVGTAAISGALYSGALGSVPGLGFFARGAEQAARAL